jgi:hypothetical protein
MPEIREVREMIEDDVIIIVANLSAYDDIKKAKGIVSDYGLEDVSYYDVNDDLTKNFDILGVPAAIYIDPEGKIKKLSFGPETANDILEKILK